MAPPPESNIPEPRLGHQALGRAWTDMERVFADTLQSIYATGTHDFEQVAHVLNDKHFPRPSGATDAWTAQTLHDELARLNADFDAAYAANGFGP